LRLASTRRSGEGLMREPIIFDGRNLFETR